ncbi:WSC domain-containing protein [Coniochaeta sp. 2T2.1]|nr:WSC domain-containing protein [Coniochaeta sp. 2T2.1]
MFVHLAIVAALASGAMAHTAAFTKGMYCKNGNNASEINQNSNVPVTPLYQLSFKDFWLQADRHCPDFPPPEDEFLDIPSGGSFMVELAHNQAFTSLSYGGSLRTDWPDGGHHPADWHAKYAGNCTEDDGALHNQDEETSAGTAFAISYESDITKVKLENTVIFSVLKNSPFRREAWYDVPAGMPACPPGGCHCMWSWVPMGCGQPNMYLQPIKCNVTGQTSTRKLGIPEAPVFCEGDQSKCVTGPKQPFVWQQLDGNNIFPPGGRTPSYNSKCGFNPGAQTDIFVGSPPSAVPARESPPTIPNRLGCFQDSTPRLLPFNVRIGEVFTPTICKRACTEAGYKYAGVQNAAECWCGDIPPPSASLLPDSACNVECTGSISTCGAPWRMEVYRSNYLGCFTDRADPRVFPVLIPLGGDRPSLNRGLCVRQCIEYGYRYAGLENGGDCYCGDEPPAPSTSVSEDQCSTPCPDTTSDQTCGAPWRLDVLATSLTPSRPAPLPVPKEWSAVGCYADSSTARVLPVSRNVANLSVPSCLDACNGFAYAGVEFGQECYCGTALVQAEKRPDGECDIPCKGDGSSFCGSVGRLNVYSRLDGGTGMSTSTRTGAASTSKSLLGVSSSKPVDVTSSASQTAKITSTSSPTKPVVVTSSAFSTSTSSPVKAATSTIGPANPVKSTNLYVCQARGWNTDNGACANIPVAFGPCVNLRDVVNGKFYHAIRSSGPDRGAKCVLYNSDNCDAKAEKYELEYPGVDTFGNQNARWGSVSCVRRLSNSGSSVMNSPYYAITLSRETKPRPRNSEGVVVDY